MLAQYFSTLGLHFDLCARQLLDLLQYACLTLKLNELQMCHWYINPIYDHDAPVYKPLDMLGLHSQFIASALCSDFLTIAMQ